MNRFAKMLTVWMGDRSYEVAAPSLGVSVGTLHAYRHGRSFPPASRVAALANVLGVPERKLRQVIDRARHAPADSRATPAPQPASTEGAAP